MSTKQTGSTTEEIILLHPKRVNNITLRLTDDELDTIEEQARKLNLNRSDYLRHQALKSVRRFKPKPMKNLDTLQYRELATVIRAYPNPSNIFQSHLPPKMGWLRIGSRKRAL